MDSAQAEHFDPKRVFKEKLMAHLVAKGFPGDIAERRANSIAAQLTRKSNEPGDNSIKVDSTWLLESSSDDTLYGVSGMIDRQAIKQKTPREATRDSAYWFDTEAILNALTVDLSPAPKPKKHVVTLTEIDGVIEERGADGFMKFVNEQHLSGAGLRQIRRVLVDFVSSKANEPAPSPYVQQVLALRKTALAALEAAGL